MKTIDSFITDFLAKGDFAQILVLDNFESLLETPPKDVNLQELLLKIVSTSTNGYLVRSAFKNLCSLTISTGRANRYKTFGLLLEHIERTVDNNIRVVALKFLPFFNDLCTPEILEEVKLLCEDDNGDVASHALICLGAFAFLSERSDASAASTIKVLSESRRYFVAANDSVENRVDAILCIGFIDLLEAIILHQTDTARQYAFEISDTAKMRKLYDFASDNLELDYLLFDLINNIKEQFELISDAPNWTETLPAIQKLFTLRLQLNMICETGTASIFYIKELRKNTLDYIYIHALTDGLPNEIGKLRRLAQMALPTPLHNFLEELIETIPDVKEIMTEDIELLAVLLNNFGGEAGMQLYQRIQRKEITVVGAIKGLLAKNKTSGLSVLTGSVIGEEVYYSLMNRLRKKLPDYPEDKLSSFGRVLEEVIRYVRATQVGFDKKKFSFLFTQAEGGKGSSAIEQDLQDSMISFFLHSNIADGFDHELVRFIDGGRVDIVYQKEQMTIPLELKRCQSYPTSTEIEANYIAQAQTYASGYDQLGIFIVMELSDKQKGVSPNFRDWFDIHHLPPREAQQQRHPDLIVSVIIPGNRTTPSAKSKYM